MSASGEKKDKGPGPTPLRSLRARIPGRAQPKQRPRLGKNGAVYTPGRTAGWETAAAWILDQAFSDQGYTEPLRGPLSVVITSIRQRPKSHKHQEDPGSRDYCTPGPDIDNVAKAALDALEKSAAIKNDREVVELFVRKVWASGGEPPGVEIVVFEIHESLAERPALLRC